MGEADSRVVKLNTDGSFCGSTGLVGCGGVVRDDAGRWVMGFSRSIGMTNSFAAKLWGLRGPSFMQQPH